MLPRVVCPICGSENLQQHRDTRVAIVPYGAPTPFEVVEYACQECGEAGDFAQENDQIIIEAEKAATQSSIVNMADQLSAHGASMAHFERALRLPARTVARWKAQGCSASGAALMRVVTTYPWLLEVADNDFDPAVAVRKMVEEAAIVVANAASSLNFAAVVLPQTGAVALRAEGTFQFHGTTAASGNAIEHIKLEELSPSSK